MKASRLTRSAPAAAAAFTVLVVIAALALAACGGSDTTASSPPSAAPGQASASPSFAWSPTMSPAPIPVVRPGDKLPSAKALATLFAYDTAEPLGYAAAADQPQSGCSVDRISFNCEGNEAAGYLVTPEGAGPFPVVVYAPGWRTDVNMFLDDAAALAGKGYAGLLLQEPGWATYWSFDPQDDCWAVVQTVTQVRRGLDLIETLPQIDARRIGFAGWSNGAHLCGGILAGVDARIKAYVLIGMARPATNYRGLMGSLPKGAEGDRLEAQLALWDPLNYLSRNHGSAFLILSGKGDVNAMSDAKAFLAAAPNPKTWKVYDGGHSPTPGAAKFWQGWMTENL
jgi:hypothetical protein